jgi:acyl-CoA thioesterase FadM
VHAKRIDLRWRDLDAYGHVNQAVYLTFAEEVLDHWREPPAYRAKAARSTA